MEIIYVKKKRTKRKCGVEVYNKLKNSQEAFKNKFELVEKRNQ